MDSPLCQAVSDDADVDEMFETYETVLCDIANHIAPRRNIRRRAGRLARLGSMTTVVGRVVSVVVWSAVIDDHVQLTTVAVGSMLYESGTGCIGQRKRRIGSRDGDKRVTPNHFSGDHCPACWAAIESQPVMVTTRLTALQHFLPVRSRTCAPQRQVIRRQWDMYWVVHVECRRSDRVHRLRSVAR